VAGRKSIVDYFDKSIIGSDRWLMMLGTLWATPVAAVAGLKTMEILRGPGAYEKLMANGERLQAMFTRHLQAAGVPHKIVGHPTLFDVLFTEHDVRNYRDIQAADAQRSARFNAVLRANGVFKSPGKLYAHLALTQEDFDWTEKAIAAAQAVAKE
jgi:glutamate-1-semialdehyde 2,1-aminomutase